MRRKSISPFKLKLSEKLMDLGNLVAIALVFGQFISSKEFSFSIFSVGLIIAIICYVVSYMVSS